MKLKQQRDVEKLGSVVGVPLLQAPMERGDQGSLQGRGQVGGLPAGGCPPLSGESRTCTSFAIARASAGAKAGRALGRP